MKGDRLLAARVLIEATMALETAIQKLPNVAGYLEGAERKRLFALHEECILFRDDVLNGLFRDLAKDIYYDQIDAQKAKEKTAT